MAASPRSAVIVGTDAVSPLGTELETQWQRLVAGQSGIGPLTRFPVDDAFPVHIAGQVPDFDPAPFPFLRPRKMALWPSPLFSHALLTAHRALANSGIEIDAALAPKTAVTYSSAVGGQDAVLSADRRMIADRKLPPPYANPNACINMVGGKVSMHTGATGPILATITACATGLTSMIVGAMLIADHRADVAICGAADFCLVAPIVAGFATMNGAFQHNPDGKAPRPEAASRPFSVHRRGFVISEGAAAVILAATDFAEAHGLVPLARIAGWAMTSDAHHYVAPHLPTVTRCIAQSIDHAGISTRDVAAVNAHAASTKIGDRVEYEALQAVFGDRIPPATANKSMIGHAMGASSAIETVFAVEAMRRGVLPPTINYRPDPQIEMDCTAEGQRPLEQPFVLKNAFGFGGANACVVLERTAA
ncbi:MAG: beta-ketoacyl-[acyl-carrier-protein] synthase family protein [Desulfobacterales bacterium]|jgi:3-oxoacyl-[acyl-carrier-protein] synthase II